MAAARPGECCGVQAPPAGGPMAAAWNGMSPWYTKFMSPATASLACSLLGQLGAFDEEDTGKRFLETHCGDAFMASKVLPLPGVKTYTAADFSEGMLSHAKVRLGDRATIVEAESTALPFESGSFDRYMSNMGCCCVSDLDAKLKEAVRVLALDGVAAMSMRIEDGDEDTAFMPVREALSSFGFQPPPVEREGLKLGKDLPALRAKLMGAGFSSVRAWRTWITMPIQNEEEYLAFVTAQGPIKKFLGGLEEPRKEEALKALREAGCKALAEGAIQISAAAVVAKK